MQKYYSQLLVQERNQKEGIFCKGRGWQIAFEYDPKCGLLVGPKGEPAKEIVVCTQSIERAQYVVDMLFAAYCLLHGEPLDFESTQVLPKRPESTRDIIHCIEKGMKLAHCGTYHLPETCLIVAEVAKRRARQYALFKYALSHHIVPLSAAGLDPQRDWMPGKAVSNLANEHVFNAYAIISAYSVLEELSIELRASGNQPSKIGNDWNPVVRADLENRLCAKGIDLSESILWHRRDTPTKIQRKRSPPDKGKCAWARGKIRDTNLEVVDAIAYASWLRSSVSAHRLPRLAQSLTIYDVANVQHLARRLLLEVLGFWGYYRRHPEIVKLYESGEA